MPTFLSPAYPLHLYPSHKSRTILIAGLLLFLSLSHKHLSVQCLSKLTPFLQDHPAFSNPTHLRIRLSFYQQTYFTVLQKKKASAHCGHI